MLKEFPVNSNVPPVAALYHFTVPVFGVAEIVTLPAPHLDPGVVAVIDAVAFTVMKLVSVTVDVPSAFVASKVTE